MNGPQATIPSAHSKNMTSGILARGGQILFMIVFISLVLFISAGTLRWTAALIYIGVSLTSVLVNAYFMLRTSPETVVERGQAKGWQDWDKLVSGLWAVMQYLALPLVAGLDARFHWTGEVGWAWQGLGLAIYCISLAGGGWSMITNAYFSTAARIQSDRGQQVCKSGPYRFIRHPGYACFILQSAGMAILLGSWWALIPAAGAMGLLVTRTAFEDRLLQNELAGYQEYTHEVKYRLVPGVW